MPLLRGAWFPVVFAVGLVSCVVGDVEVAEVADDGPSVVVVASNSILGDVVEQLVGDDAQIEVPIGRDLDMNLWFPSTSDGELVLSADLVVANGLDMSDHQLWDSASRSGVPVVELVERLDPITMQVPGQAGPEGDQPGEDGAEHVQPVGPLDRHVWLDPVRMADGVLLLADELADRPTRSTSTLCANVPRVSPPGSSLSTRSWPSVSPPSTRRHGSW